MTTRLEAEIQTEKRHHMILETIRHRAGVRATGGAAFPACPSPCKNLLSHVSTKAIEGRIS
jgi:hypothetical protein